MPKKRFSWITKQIVFSDVLHGYTIIYYTSHDNSHLLRKPGANDDLLYLL